MSIATSMPAATCAISDLQTKYLPAPLIRARTAVMHHAFCQDLSRTARQVLYGVLSFFTLGRPDQPVFAFRDKLLPETLLGSRSALYRGLQEAEDRGYIRREQVRLRGSRVFGRFTRSHIWLETKALVMLGLATPPICLPEPDGDRLEAINAWESPEGATNLLDPEAGRSGTESLIEAVLIDPEATYPQQPSINMGHGIQESEPTLELQLKEQLHEQQRIPNRPLSKNFDDEIDKATRLPKEVLPLQQLGVSRTLICSLMGFAKSQGQQGKLGTVIKLFWRNIEGLRGRSVFAYLRKILGQKRDFARMLQLQAADTIDGTLAADSVRRLEEKLALLLQRGDGWQVRNTKGELIGTLRSNGENGHVEGFDHKRGRYAIPANARLMEAVEEGRLVFRPS